MDNLILSATLIVAFLMCIKAYTIGIQHGKQLSQGNIPKVQINPVQAVVEAVETHKNEKEAEKATEELADILDMDYKTALQAVKKER